MRNWIHHINGRSIALRVWGLSLCLISMYLIHFVVVCWFLFVLCATLFVWIHAIYKHMLVFSWNIAHLTVVVVAELNLFWSNDTYPVFRSNCNQQKFYFVKTFHNSNFKLALPKSLWFFFLFHAKSQPSQPNHLDSLNSKVKIIFLVYSFSISDMNKGLSL